MSRKIFQDARKRFKAYELYKRVIRSGYRFLGEFSGVGGRLLKRFEIYRAPKTCSGHKKEISII